MEPRKDLFSELQQGLSDLIAKSPAADLERNMRALMTQTFSRMDLITREEFDTQLQLLERALQRVQELEIRVAALEESIALKEAASSPAHKATKKHDTDE